MKRYFTFLQALVMVGLLVSNVYNLAFAEEGASISLAVKERYESLYEKGVQAYRKGEYAQASQIFSELHSEKPEVSKFTYYWAISEAQQGHIDQARRLYEEIVTLDPNGVAAEYARKGLSYLPDTALNSLDAPPMINNGAMGRNGNSQASIGNGSASVPTSPLPAGMSMQDWMAMQMMMSQSNGLGGNALGGNPMAGMMMPGLLPGGQAGGSASMDPSLFSNMLMNQMLMQSMPGGSDSSEAQ